MKSTRTIFYFLLWTVVILAGYYFFHRPIAAAQGLAVLTALYNVAVTFAAHAACAGLAGLLLRKRLEPGLAAFSIQAAAGAGIFALVWLGLGALELFHGWSAAILLAAALVGLRKEIWAWLSQLRAWADVWRESGRIERAALIMAGLLALGQLWIALAPPVKYDALTYHLALPRQYLEAGRLLFVPDNPYWGHPQLVEMLYTWTAALGQPATAAVYAWWAGVILMCGIAGAARAFIPEGETSPGRAAAAAVFFVMAGATARWMLGWAYTDLFSAWFGLGVVYALFSWQRTGESRWLVWVGVFTGFTVSTKYTAGVIALAAYLLVWVVRGFRRPPLRAWALSAGVALLVFLPWAAKNFFFTGNPLFPYLLPTAWYSADRLATANLPPTDYAIIPQVILPLYVTWAGVDSASGPSTDLGPLLVLFALPALIVHRRDPKARFLGLALLIGWLAISLAGARYGHLQQPRLYFALLPAMALLAGWGWPRLSDMAAEGFRLRNLAGGVVLAVLALALWQDAARTLTARVIPVDLGVITQETFLEENTGAYIVAMRALDDLPADSKVLMLWEARGLYAPANVTADPWIDNWRNAYRSLGGAQAVLRSWRSAGFTHVLVYAPGMDFVREDDRAITPESWSALDSLLASFPEPVEAGSKYYRLYEITAGR